LNVDDDECGLKVDRRR